MDNTKSRMPETMYRASRCCRILGNPTAYLVLREMGTSRHTPGQISRTLGISLSSVSFTLRHLRNLDLVRYETAGRTKEYWVKDPEVLRILQSLEAFVETMRRRMR